MKHNATLRLSDGTEYRGIGHGHMANTADKELIFNTGVVGYMQSLTDPSSQGQILVNTFPLIGNYGVATQDIESDSAAVAGLVVGHISDTPSNFRSSGSLDGFLKAKGIPCISGIDTRGLMHKMRDSSSKLSAKIVFDNPTTLQVAKPLIFRLPEYTVGDKPLQVALVDLGIKKSTKDILLQYATLHVFGQDVEYNQVMSKNPQAIIVVGGQGNPSSQRLAINLIKANLATKNPLPMLGVGLGHQILALGHDCKLIKLSGQHRGNQAVRRLQTGKIYQTDNNTSYTVSPKNLSPAAKISYQNVNDKSIEGLYYKKTKSIGVQFYPDDISTVAGTRFVWDGFFGQFD